MCTIKKSIILSALLMLISFNSHAYMRATPTYVFHYLYRVAAQGRVDELMRMVDKGADIDVENEQSDTGLCVAIQRENVIAFKTFKDAGADIEHSCTRKLKNYRSFLKRVQGSYPGEEITVSSSWNTGYTLGAAALIGGGIALAGGGGSSSSGDDNGGGSADPDEDIDVEEEEEYCKDFSGAVTCAANQVCSQYTCGVCSACMDIVNPCEADKCSQGCYKNVDCSASGYTCGSTNECGGCDYCVNTDTEEPENSCDENLAQGKCVYGCYKDVACAEGYSCFSTNECGGCELCVEQGNANPSNFVLSANENVYNEEPLTNTGDDKVGTWGGIYVQNNTLNNFGDITLTSEKIGNAVGILSCAVGNISSCFANYELLQGGDISNSANIDIVAPKENIGIFSSSGNVINNGNISIKGNDSTGIALVGYGSISNYKHILVEGKITRLSEYLNPFATNENGTINSSLPYQNSNIFFSNYFLPYIAGNGETEKYGASSIDNSGNLDLVLETDKRLVLDDDGRNDKAIEAASMMVIFDPHLSEEPLTVSNSGNINATLKINAQKYNWDKYGLAGIFVLSPKNRENPDLPRNGFEDIQFTSDTDEILANAYIKVLNNGNINVSSDGKAFGILASGSYVESIGDINVSSNAQSDYSAYGIVADYVDLLGRVNVSKIGDVAINAPVINFRSGSSIGQGRVIANVARNYSNLSIPLVEVYNFYNYGYLRVENDYVSTLGSSYISFVNDMKNYGTINHAHIYKGSYFTNYADGIINEAFVLGDDNLNTYFGNVRNEGYILVDNFDVNTSDFSNALGGIISLISADNFTIDLNENEVSAFTNEGEINVSKTSGEAKGINITSKEAQIENSGFISVDFQSAITDYTDASFYEGIVISSKEDHSSSLPLEENLKTVFNNTGSIMVRTDNSDADLYGINISNAILNNHGNIAVIGGKEHYLFSATNSIINQYNVSDNVSVFLDNSVFNNMSEAILNSVSFYSGGDKTSVVNNASYMENTKFYGGNISLNNDVDATIFFGEGAEVEGEADADLNEFINDGSVNFADTTDNKFLIKANKFTNTDTGNIYNLGYLSAKEFVNDGEMSNFNYISANSFINDGNIISSLLYDPSSSNYGLGQIMVENGYFENTGNIYQTDASDTGEYDLYGLYINNSEINSTGYVRGLPMYISGKSYGLVENVEALFVYETSDQGISANKNSYIYANGLVDGTPEKDNFILIQGNLNGYISAEGYNTTVINDGNFGESHSTYLMVSQQGATVVNKGELNPELAIALLAQNGGVVKNSGVIYSSSSDGLNGYQPLALVAGSNDATVINDATGLVKAQDFVLAYSLLYLSGPNVSGRNDGEIVSIMTDDDYAQNVVVYSKQTSEEGFVNNGTITLEGGWGGIAMYAHGYVDGTSENDRYVKMVNSETGVINIGCADCIGMYANGSNSIVINNGTINISGENSTGMIGAANGTVIDNSIQNPTPSPLAMYVSNGATLLNNGVINFDGELDLNAMQTEDSSIVAGIDSTIKALSLSGNLFASSDVVKGSNENSYVNKSVIDAADNGINVVSQSVMFETGLQNAEDNTKDIVYERKSFESLLGHNDIAEYLEINYAQGNGVEVFDNLKSATNISALNSLVEETLGTDFIPVLAYQNLNRERRFNANAEDLVLAQTDKQERILVNSDNWYEEHKNYKGVKGYEDKIFGINALIDTQKSENLRQGFGFGIYKADSEYANDNTRDDNIFRFYLSSKYENNNYGMLLMPYVGYSEGKYKRENASEKHESDVQNYYLGLNTKAWLNKKISDINIKPTIVLNVEHINQNGISEKGGIKTDDADITSIEAGLGMYADKNIRFNDASSLTLKGGVMYYYELNDNVFKDTDAKLSSLYQNSYLIKGYDNNRSRGVINFKADYNVKNLNVYGQILKLIENDDNMVYNVGLKIGF